MTDASYPKNWAEMSLDTKLMFGYHISMMAMMVGGSYLTISQELLITATIAALIALISFCYRQKKHWRWPGIKPLDVIYAVGGVALIALFLYSATPLYPPNNSHIVPWYLAGLGIGLFGILQSIKVVCGTQTEFALNCVVLDQYGHESNQTLVPSSLPEAQETNWKRITKTIYMVVFISVWVCGVMSFYFLGTAIKGGSAEPTVTQTEALDNHGKIVYVTPNEKERVDCLQFISSVGVAIALLGGVILHFLAGVKLVPNAPTLAEYLNRGKNNPSAPTS